MQDIRSGPNTYGHRFLTTSGRAGRAIKVKTFDDYQERLLENFVILDRREREQKIRARARNRTRAGLAAASAPIWRRSPRCCAKCPTSSSIPPWSPGTFRWSSCSSPRKC